MKNRVEFQEVELSRDNLIKGKGTSVNKSARKHAQDRGEEGDQAGHLCAKRLGCRGVMDNVIPQNAQINMGNWKEMEKVIAKDVQKYDKVKLSQLPVYNEGETRPKEILFKVETEGGKLIRYGKVDNPFTRPADGA